MQPLTTDAARVFSSSAEGRFIAWPYYEGTRIGTEPLPVTGGSISCDTDAAVQMSGELMIADPSGALVPRSYGAALSPFGTQLRISYRAELGVSSAEVQIGTFRIDEVPELQEYLDQYRRGDWVHRGASIKVNLAGLFADVDDNTFEAPRQLTPAEVQSTWLAIRNIAGMPITIDPRLPDKPFTRALTFEESRLDALYDLADNLGGILYETPQGTLSARPAISTGEPVWDISYGPDGKVIVPPRSFSRDKFANVFISRGEGVDQFQAQGRAAITDGPLREGGPMGSVKSVHVSPLIISNTMATADARTRRANFLAGQASVVELSALPNPALQGGDLVSFGYYNRTIRGELKGWTLSQGDLMKYKILANKGPDPWA